MTNTNLHIQRIGSTHGHNIVYGSIPLEQTPLKFVSLTIIENLKETFWFNSHIKIHKRVVFYDRWYRSGVKYVKDLLGPDGSLFTL